ncbi:MAG: ABC transporter ATP-binding protein [Lachnospiraceae bacterium]|jgi:ABC-type bacteriocin/lantibiotic exporter with double-glycine peptidase domain|nr:ABC transporter ATP-binding protein [uncultured Acetatifactor sp.]MCI9231080.1 ABC transporter ATP-binding protein [Lachnospiraceae bacterium]MCI9571744.1 ABC transporter ATP-binding protein [Lachnospiraceae bacterium]
MKMLNRLKSTSIILKNHKLKFAALLAAFSLISFAVPLTAPFMIQSIMGKIESGMAVTPWMILSLIMAALFMLALDYMINVYGNVMCANLIYRGSADLYQDLFALPYGEREAKYKDEDLLQNITAFTDSALSLWVMIIRYVIGVIVIGVLLVLAVNVHYTVSFFLLAHIGITVFAGKKLQGISEAYASRLQGLEAEKNNNIEELMHKADFINMNSLQSIVKARFDQTRRDIFRVQAEQLHQNNLYISLQKVISELVSGFIYPVLGFLPCSVKIAGGNLASVKSILEESGTQTQSIQEMAAYIPYNTVPIDNGKKLFGLAREVTHSQEKGSQAHDTGCALAIDGLCFEAEGRKILSDINLCIKEGEHIAVMGENGSGKSTLLRCIMGMYAPTSGSITLFGKSPANAAAYFRENCIFAYMPAASQLYEASIDDNILMGSFHEASLESIKNATGVSDFSNREISSISELSGGEQQRLNAARAFSNGDAKIILLDEPTASLDREHAEMLMRYIRSSSATVIYTTHREEDAAFADRVIRMCGGKEFCNVENQK